MGERGVQRKGKKVGFFLFRSISCFSFFFCSRPRPSSNLDTSSSSLSLQIKKSGDSDATKALGAFENAALFVIFVAAVTFLLVVAFKNGMSRLISAYMCVSGFSIFLVLCGLISIQAIATLRLPVDVYTYSIALWNFAAVGTCALFVCRAPLTLKQIYLVAVGVATAFIFTGVPEWSTWALLGGMAAYDLWAVLSPTGPLKLLLDAAHERGEDIPALIYEARPNRRAVVGVDGVALSQGRGNRSGSNDNNPGIPLGVAGGAFFFSSMSALSGTMARRCGVRGGGGGGGGRRGGGGGRGSGGEGEAATAAAVARTNISSTSSSEPVAPEGGGAGPLLVEASVRDASLEQEQQQQQQHQQQQRRENTTTTNNDDDTPASVSSSDDDDFPHSGLPDGIKLGLGDFIFYSVLVGRASMYDGISAVSAAAAVLAGLGMTLLLLAARRRALPALPISIALGAVCTAGARFCLEPVVMPLAGSMLFF